MSVVKPGVRECDSPANSCCFPHNVHRKSTRASVPVARSLIDSTQNGKATHGLDPPFLGLHWSGDTLAYSVPSNLHQRRSSSDLIKCVTFTMAGISSSSLSQHDRFATRSLSPFTLSGTPRPWLVYLILLFLDFNKVQLPLIQPMRSKRLRTRVPVWI